MRALMIAAGVAAMGMVVALWLGADAPPGPAAAAPPLTAASSALGDLVVDALGGRSEPGRGVEYEGAWRAPTGLAALARHAAAHSHGATEDDRRAMRQGLRPGVEGGPCEGAYELRVEGVVTCSHGDDAALAGSPPLFGRTVPADPGPADPGRAGAEAARVCIGDGASGNRVQLMYVRRSDQPDRFASARASAQSWSTTIDEAMVLSARQTGGSRRVRWATDASCVPTVLNVVVPATATEFSSMVQALVDKGYTSASRKYLVAADTGSYCGLGEVVSDSSAGAGNLNNGHYRSMFASVAPRCWTDTVAAHELMHALGAVQKGAPNASAYGHCTDGAELMCYVDGAGTVVRAVCPVSNEDLYDCRHDDYFSTSPAAGSYLKTHWNTADSSFLDASGSLAAPFSPADPSAAPGTGTAQVSWSAPLFDGGSAITGYVVTASPGGATASTGPAARTVSVGPLDDGRSYTFTVQAVNAVGIGNPSSPTDPVTPTPVITTRHDLGGLYPEGLGGTGADAYFGLGSTLAKVTPAGVRSAVAGGFDPISEPPADGTAAATTQLLPRDVAVHPTTGDLWFSDTRTDRIRRITAGKVYTVAGGPGVMSPGRIAFDAGGNLYVVDTEAPRVWKVAAGTGVVTPFAGTSVVGSTGDGGPATAARLAGPAGIAVDASGNVFVADQPSHRVRKIAPGGTITTAFGDGNPYLRPDGGLATATSAPYPRGVAWGNGRLYVETAGAIRAIGADGRVTTWVGTMGDYGFSGDGGPSAAALIDYTDDITIASGHLLLVTQAGEGLWRLRAVGPPTTAEVVAPGAPAAVTAVAGRESATVRWVPPANGGSPLTSMVVTAQPGGATVAASGTATEAVVTGLTAGQQYTFSVRATNAVGPGSAATSNVVTPLARPAYDPFASWTGFVRQQYVDFAGRTPTASESSAGVAALSAGSTSPGAFVLGLSRSNAWAGSYGPVARLYFAYFLRVPDIGGLDHWVGKVRTGTPLSTVSQSFASSAEFKARYGSLTNRQFVVKVYENVLGRVGDTAGITYWAGQLDQGRKTRGQVMVGFSESPEYKKVRAAEIDTILLYRGLLRRMPTSGEFTSAVAQVKAGTPMATVIAGVLRLPAYAARITP